MNGTLAIKLKQTLVIGEAIADEDDKTAWPGHIQFVDWIDEDRIVYCTLSGHVVCRHLKSQTVLWQHDNPSGLKYADFSLCRNKRIFAILNCHMGSEVTDYQITLINCDTGELLVRWDKAKINEILGVDHALPTNIALMPVSGKLLVTTFSSTFGANGFIIASDYKQVERRFDTDRHVQRISASPNDDRIVMLADKYVVSLLDLPSNQWLFLQGERVYKKKDSEEGDSSPGINHVFHDGKALVIFNNDGGLCGTVYTHSLSENPVKKCFGPNAHNELDVDFERQRIATTGTGMDITMWDFDGGQLGYLPKITTQRNTCIKFSPSFQRLAIGSWDNTVSLYELSLEDHPGDPKWSDSTTVELEGPVEDH